MSKLTQKQENFVRNLFIGMSQREAYVEAGYSSNQLPATIDRHAFDLANEGKVLARLNELNEAAESKKVLTVKERKERLSELSKKDEYAVPAIREINKMDGAYAPEKLAILAEYYIVEDEDAIQE